MQIHKDSWHWKLISKETFKTHRSITNSCEYLWALVMALVFRTTKICVLMVGLLLATVLCIPFLITLLAATLLFIPEMIYQYMYDESVYEIVATLFNGNWFLLSSQYGSLWFLGGVGMVAISILVGILLAKIHVQAPESVSQVAEIFKARFIDKVCIPISIVDKNGNKCY